MDIQEEGVWGVLPLPLKARRQKTTSNGTTKTDNEIKKKKSSNACSFHHVVGIVVTRFHDFPRQITNKRLHRTSIIRG